MSTDVVFLLRTQLKDFLSLIEAPIEGLTFSPVGLNYNLKITRKGPGCAIADLVCTEKVSETDFEWINAFLEGYFKNHAKSGIVLPFNSEGGIEIEADGFHRRGNSPSFQLLPKSIQSILSAVEKNLVSHLERFWSLLAWQSGVMGFAQPIDHSSLYWKTGGDTFSVVPLHSQVESMGFGSGIFWGESEQIGVQELWRRGLNDAPLPHLILREAVDIFVASPRASLVIAAAALEISVKQFISESVPETSWLMEKVPSPPVAKMIKTFIPVIAKPHPIIQRWAELTFLFKVFDELFEARNSAVHRGFQPEPSDVRRYLNAVHDMLYIFDALQGEEWALKRTTRETREAMNWPNPDGNRFCVGKVKVIV